ILRSFFVRQIQTPSIITLDMVDLSIEKKLKAIWELQQIDSKIDQLNLLKGELPMEVADLEDEIVGLQTRQENIRTEIKTYEQDIAGYKTNIKLSEELQKKYKKQLDSVKNNREFEALNKELEIAGLEVLAAQKRIKEAQFHIDSRQEGLTQLDQSIEVRKKDLEFKQKELTTIVKDTEDEEKNLMDQRKKIEKDVEDRLVKAYTRIRKNVKNGIAVAPIVRGSCGGCFSKIPPQRQSDIKQHFKIIDCEHCGRILVDNAVTGIYDEKPVEEEKPKRRVRSLKTAK
ncbi:MAG TPA: C4-type zinc ribbon domain-containing protein, partial [Membranihabitans sp.]|nr:C4-type zinc ribbon domain-containing protein [Membranihabitans sp.]